MLFFFTIANPIRADFPPPPPPGGGHGGGGNQPPGGGAPIGEGALLLVLMAAGYGIKQVINVRRKLRAEEEAEHLFDSATE